MHGAEIRSLVGGSHCKFVAIGLAEKHRTVTPELRRHSRFIGRHEIVEDMRTGRRTYARRAEHVLDGKRNALKGSGVALCDACVGRFGHFDGAFWSMKDKRIERPRLLDRRLMRACQFGRGEGFIFQSVSCLDQTERGQFTHDGTHPHVAARHRARAFPARRALRNEIPFLWNDLLFPSTSGAPLRERRSSTSIRAHRRYTLSKPLAWNDALRSFHHLGHHEIIVLAHRCVPDDIFRNAPVSYRIDPFLHRHGSYRSHRFDALDLNLRKLLDKCEHGVEFAFEMSDLILCDGDAREVRNAADGVCVDCHAISRRYFSTGFRLAYSRAAFRTTTQLYDRIPRIRSWASETNTSTRAPAGSSRPRAAACPASMGEKSPDPCACAFACSGASAPPASGNAGATSLMGPSSRMMRLIKPRAGRPLRTLVSTVLSSRAARNAARCGGNILASGQNRNAVPICTPAAPSINAATSPRASAMPPEAITGMLTASTTCGSSAKRPTCVAMSTLRNIPR